MKRLWQNVNAQIRGARVLLQGTRYSFLILAFIVVGGALILHFFYTLPDSVEHPGFAEALHAAFALIFFEMVLPFPQQWYLQILFFLIPLLGLAVVIESLPRFGALLISRQDRGQKWQVAMAATMSGHVIVCGMGKLGYRTVLELGKLDRKVAAVEHDPEGRFVERTKELDFSLVPVVIGDARRAAVLHKAGVERADVIVACTDDELTNLHIAFNARELNPDIKIVMRMFDPELANWVEESLNIHTAYSTSALTAPIFAAAAMDVDVKYSFYEGDDLLIVSEIHIEPESKLIGWSERQIETKYDLSVISYQGKRITGSLPDPNLKLKEDDRMLVLASLETLQQLRKLNRGSVSK